METYIAQGLFFGNAVIYVKTAEGYVRRIAGLRQEPHVFRDADEMLEEWYLHSEDLEIHDPGFTTRFEKKQKTAAAGNRKSSS